MSVFLKKNGLLLLVVFAILFFPIFWRLANPPLSIWDEARVGVNALEIDGFKTAIAPYYEGKPDMFSLKPPLLPVLQRACMELAGYNVLGVRLPSAIATFGLCILFMWFGYRRFMSVWPGIISSLVLATAPGFMRDHIARTGDYDALLAFFMAGYALFYFVYLENPALKKYLYLTTAFLLFGVLTKGIAALLPMPGLLIYTLLDKKAGYVFRRKEFYLLALVFAGLVATVYGLREYYTPGYLKLVFEGELWAVPTTPVGGHPGPWWYYFDNTLVAGFASYSAFMLLGLISGFTGPFKDKLFTYLLAYLAGYFIIISIAATKTPWYDAPFYPLAALAAGVFIYKVIIYFLTLTNVLSRQTLYFSLIALILFAFPYFKSLRSIKNAPPMGWDMQMYDKYMGKIRREMPKLGSYSVVDKGYNPQALFLSESYTKSGMHVTHKNVREKPQPGETVICCQHDAWDDLKKKYSYTVIQNANPCLTVRITGPADSLHTAPF